jgi:PAS domain S-box-containing protein
VRRVVGFIVDVSEGHADREALRESEERFRYAAQAVNGVIYDVDYRTSQVTRFGTEGMLGASDAEIGGLRGDWIARIHPEDAVHFRALRAQPCPPGGVQESEYRVRHRDGHWVHVWDRAILVAEESGKPLRRIGFVQDISERHREREALRAQASVLATLHQGVALLDDGLVLCTTNAAFDQRFGAPAGGLAGCELRSLLAVDATQWQRICDEMAAVSESTDTAIELPCRHRDGSEFHCHVLLRALRPDGERQVVMTLQAPAGAAQP